MVKSVQELIAGGMHPEMAKQYRKEAMQEINLPSPAQYMKKMLKEKLKGTKMRKPSGRINMDDITKLRRMEKQPGKIKRKLSPAKMPNQPNFRSRPEKPKALGPIRPLRERSQSKLISRRRAMKKK